MVVGSILLRDLHLSVTSNSSIFIEAPDREMLPKGSSFLECSWRVGDQLCSEISESVNSAN